MPEEPRTILQIVLINETGDSYYRMRWPGRQLSEQAPTWRVINLDANAKERFEWGEKADLLVLYQSHDLDLLPLIKRRRDLGKKTLVEYNDNFYAPAPSSPVSKEWSSPLLWQIYETFMRESDGVLVTGTGLVELFSQKTKTPLYIMENHMPQDPPAFDQVWPGSDGALQIGWAGSLGHMPDILAATPLLKRILEIDPQIKIHLMGNSSIPDMLQLPRERLHFTEWGSMEQYLKFWEPVHIGLAPLIDTPYNRCRSDVKALEMSAQGVLPLLTNALPYRDFSEKTGSPGLSSFAEFFERVEFYHLNRDELEAQARRCHDYVCSSRVGTRRLERLELYKRMLPSERDTFAWPVEAGYHEFPAGVAEPSSHSRTVVQINQNIKAKNYAQAHEIAARAVLQNPWSADLQLLELRCLASVKIGALAPKMEMALRRFPDDLRFRLMQLALLTVDSELALVWEAVIRKLRDAGSTYQRAFEGEVVAMLCRQIQLRPAFGPIGEALLELFPSNAELKFAMAFHYTRRGAADKAYPLFEELAAARRNFGLNQRFLSDLDTSFIETWTAAVKARRKRGFS
ncbi:MAG: glycosyltransferase family 4 protein [Deltaproteobacteria bacterium]|nr:glycosyltransferase family 4 protein [Deltaproteobacteria bacterium]